MVIINYSLHAHYLYLHYNIDSRALYTGTTVVRLAANSLCASVGGHTTMAMANLKLISLQGCPLMRVINLFFYLACYTSKRQPSSVNSQPLAAGMNTPLTHTILPQCCWLFAHAYLHIVCRYKCIVCPLLHVYWRH